MFVSGVCDYFRTTAAAIVDCCSSHGILLTSSADLSDNYVLSVAECTQLEDPRLEWRAIQEAMLRDYLHTAQDVLEVCATVNQI